VSWYNSDMASFTVKTPQREYCAVVERGILSRAGNFIPKGSGKVFVVTTADVWQHQGNRLDRGLSGIAHEVLTVPGGEERKRLAHVETLAEEMVRRGADRTSLVVAFGGGIVNDMAGFLAAIFMRGIPVVQIPTTLLAQVDASIGGKTGVNLLEGKNLIGSFHQPLAVLIDPDVLATLPDREYRAGLFEVIKCGVIRSAPLFELLTGQRDAVLRKDPAVVDQLIEESVRIKAEVVSADERESGLRRILNFGHTFGHALEAETAYARFLHGEAVGFGMRAATHLAKSLGQVGDRDASGILDAVDRYGPIPSLHGIPAERLAARLVKDKKTIQGNVHFVLPRSIGEVTVVSGVDDGAVLSAIRSALT
jgi:3-dehydroquinate synthase